MPLGGAPLAPPPRRVQRVHKGTIMDACIHADRSRPALVHGARLPWIASPEPGVERRMLERVGGEVAIASSIVRYLPGSRFGVHTHALGEEFLVLDGIFSDADGDYPAGTYVRNPPGSSHAPFSRGGCVIFVKLRQMQPDDHDRRRVFPAERDWQGSIAPGYRRAVLQSGGGATVSLAQLEPGSSVPARPIEGGEEIFVVSGSIRMLEGEEEPLEAWSWLRHPGNRHPAFASGSGAMLWIKTGHLPAAATAQAGCASNASSTSPSRSLPK
jgi:anti-sigma factor ChrR (cupin superfamily)